MDKWMQTAMARARVLRIGVALPLAQVSGLVAERQALRAEAIK